MADRVLQLGHEYFVGPAVFGESDPLEQSLEAARQAGRVVQLADDDVDPVVYASVSNAKLGDGETECIALALQHADWSVCTDDGLARQTAVARLGGSRVLGSLRLLIHCVQASLLTEGEAFRAYELMVLHGAFLPLMIPSDFSGAS